MRPGIAAAQLLATNPTLEGAKLALQGLGLRFPGGRRFSYPLERSGDLLSEAVVLKVSRPFIAHKTELGAVKVVENLSWETLEEFAQGVSERLGAPVQEIVAEEKIAIPEGGELLLSVLNDPSFGPTLVLGEGGRLTELRRQLTHWSPTLPASQIAARLEKLPLAPLWFHPYRNLAPQMEVEPFSQLLAELGAMLTEFERLRPDLAIIELEINPLVFRRGEAIALDLLFQVQERKEEKAAPGHRPDLDRLFRSLTEAQSVAVAGVSTSNPHNLGRVLLGRLRHSFKGQTWAINPKGGELDGHPLFKSVRDLPGPPDVLVLALSARWTAPTLKEAYATFGDRLGTVLMLASGFDETSVGQELGRELRQVVDSLGSIPVLGPNTMALYAQTGSPGDVQIDFLPAGRVQIPSFADPKRNDVALIFQSGARFASCLDVLPGLGFRWSLMVGNAYQTDVADGLALAARDPGVKVAALYLEGVRQGAGQRLLEAIAACRRAGKWVIIQKGGQTAQGASTAQSHTASMSGSHQIFKDLVSQAGAHIVELESEFRDLLRLASLYAHKPLRGKRIFALNSAGYEGVLLSDALARGGLELPKPGPSVSAVLQPYLGSVLDSTNNPADVGPATPDAAYGEALRAALETGAYDGALVAVMPHGNGMEGTFPPYDARPELLGPSLLAIAAQYPQPIVVSVNGGREYEPFRRYLEDGGLAVFPEAERAARALAKFWALENP